MSVSLVLRSNRQSRGTHPPVNTLFRVGRFAKEKLLLGCAVHVVALEDKQHGALEVVRVLVKSEAREQPGTTPRDRTWKTGVAILSRKPNSPGNTGYVGLLGGLADEAKDDNLENAAAAAPRRWAEEVIRLPLSTPMFATTEACGDRGRRGGPRVRDRQTKDNRVRLPQSDSSMGLSSAPDVGPPGARGGDGQDRNHLARCAVHPPPKANEVCNIEKHTLEKLLLEKAIDERKALLTNLRRM
ncbi:hypothetical protein B0H14DRAFT_2594301 [Mycena olivaceomarginata]|nr:hypothetical protein B0H14DRAFT_2594301 [Mycena olivaceomarginata]